METHAPFQMTYGLKPSINSMMKRLLDLDDENRPRLNIVRKLEQMSGTLLRIFVRRRP